MWEWWPYRRDTSRAARRLGRCGERVAARHLRRRGLRIVGRNVQVGRSEVDLVALDGETIVLVEVKSRTVAANVEWTGLDRIDATKRRALRRAGAILRGRVCGGNETFRVDAVSVEFEKRSVGHRAVDVRWYPGILEV